MMNKGETAQMAIERLTAENAKLRYDVLTLNQEIDRLRDYPEDVRLLKLQIDVLQKRMEIIGKVASKPITSFPKRMDEMTETEGKIALVTCELAGDLSYIKDLVASPLTEKPKGVCTHNCLDKDYSTGHTLCMKELPCPDHDEKKPVDERACCTCGGAGLRDIGHAPCHSTADRHFCVSCKTTPVSEAGRTCVVCIAHNWPNNDTIKREDVPAPSEECTCDGGFDPNPGCPLHD